MKYLDLILETVKLVQYHSLLILDYNSMNTYLVKLIGIKPEMLVLAQEENTT